ncbi:MAG: hypothetical protein OXG58_07300 [Gemmatimonadetes bacterium]|nr:hypothetical protein [Gemmatimonadota bacterium]MCY3942525.1 hypothetical protein [Gemmatimonadota bacterium]
MFAALADLWAPSSTRAVADRARMGVRTTSALLGRLTRRGAVTAKGNGRRRLYVVGEPLHSVYYKLRRRRDEAAVVHGLIRFMVAFFGPDRGSDRLELRREIAGALELRALCLNGLRRGREALEACDTLIRDYGDIQGQRGIPVSWRALGSRVHALVLEGEESEAVRVFEAMCTTWTWPMARCSRRSCGTPSI